MLEVLPAGVGGRKVSLHVVQQAGHLTEHEAGRSQVEELGFGGVKVAAGPFDHRRVARTSVGAPALCGVPGRVKVPPDGRS
ncbi:MAG: hypothetical protein ACR2KK_16005 [Acidimicrobiales bacterium]